KEIRLSWRHALWHGGPRLWSVASDMRAADRSILLNETDRTYAIERLRVETGSAVVLPNGFPADLLEASRRPSSERDTLTLAFVGAWILRKGITELVKAATNLCDNKVPFHLR